MQLFYHIMVFVLAIISFVLWIWLAKIKMGKKSAFLDRHNTAIIEKHLGKINKTVEELNSKFWEYEDYLTKFQKATDTERSEIVKLLDKVTKLLEKERQDGSFYGNGPKENGFLYAGINKKIEEMENKINQQAENR